MTRTPRILHLGLGSFHRAHQAWYLHRLGERNGVAWTLAAGNLRPDMSEVIDALNRQNGVFTLESVSPAGERSYERIRAIGEVVPWTPDIARLVALGADADTRIISFTVTEAGYYLDTDDNLDTGYADLQRDIADGHSTVYGALARILRARMTAGAGPVTLLNCDNLRSNGERFRRGFLAFLARRGEPALHDWVGANTSCPNAMVDRITPRPPADLAARVRDATGWDDRCPVMAETFCQWVIEEDFCNGRPDWEQVGVEMVASVLPYEEAKIRILNASHSCIAWAGTLRGYRYIHEGVADAQIRALAHDYVTHDAIPCLRPSPIDLDAYRDTVLERFSNPHLLDTNQRVAADGFAKIPGFLGATFRDRLASGQPIEHVAMLPALFFLFLTRWSRGELPFVYQDQSMDETLARALFTDKEPLAAFCRDPILWGELAGRTDIVQAVTAGVLKWSTLEQRAKVRAASTTPVS